MMERLTIDEVIEHCRRTCEKTELFTIARGQEQGDITSKNYWEHYQVEEWLKELKQYRDAKEQGLLLKPPCKVGDTVYNLVPMGSQESSFREDIVDRIVISEDGVVIFFASGLGKNIESFGKTVFLTKAEAEKALAEMEK